MVATLKALLDTGNVSRAAEALGVTQPSVSQTLKRMRAHFGDELFVFTANQMRPTPRAIELAPVVDRLMRDMARISQPGVDFDPRTANREFILCVTDIAEYLVVAEIAKTFAAEAPGCSIRTLRIPQARLRDALERGEADLALGRLAGADRTLRQRRIGEFTATCLVSANGHWAENPLTQDAYVNARHVVVQRVSDAVDAVTERLSAMGIHRSVAASVDSHFVAAWIAAETDWISTVPNLIMAEKLTTMIPVRVVPLPFAFGRFTARLVWHGRYQNDPGHIWLRATVERCHHRVVPIEVEA
jgi:LysR family transcriptional activator of mexEF-oprN operon